MTRRKHSFISWVSQFCFQLDWTLFYREGDVKFTNWRTQIFLRQLEAPISQALWVDWYNRTSMLFKAQEIFLYKNHCMFHLYTKPFPSEFFQWKIGRIKWVLNMVDIVEKVVWIKKRRNGTILSKVRSNFFIAVWSLPIYKCILLTIWNE